MQVSLKYKKGFVQWFDEKKITYFFVKFNKVYEKFVIISNVLFLKA